MAKKKRKGEKKPKGTKGLFMAYPKPVAEALAPLSVAERKFVLQYCGECRGNATLAMERASPVGVGGKSLSYMSRAAKGSKWLQMPHIRYAVDAWMQAYALTAAEVTWRIKDMADINPSPFFELTPATSAVGETAADPGGQLRLKARIAQEDWDGFNHWIKELEVDAKTGRVTRLVLHDRMTAHRELAKINKLYSDQPIFAFNLFLQQMTDEQLLAELESARGSDTGGPVPTARLLGDGTVDAEIVDEEDV